MKRYILIYFSLVFASCTVVKKTDFNNQVYSNRSHMIGKGQIVFENDTTLTIYERNGAMYSKGAWNLSEDSRKINLKIFPHDDLNIGKFTGKDSALYFIPTDRIITIKNRKEIIYRGVTYKLEES